MPLSRYEIRNEYSLADPELYRAADKDDPEALLEGVAMAGLVGILRQLGDLAEFAAEIFHDLHEEVMATAARGHGLMIRVQELESEVPSIEKAFFSQTDHSSFFYNAGVDWHPNLQMNLNLVTQGDLPRFVMDSYEECRGPPRLFLLDKFDVAGAGSCLKRYTDPSFFKLETSGIPSADVQREKKRRKAKKRGPRWRNGETPELLPASHAKLHQLFLEECVENSVSNPARRVKLKRRLNGYPFDSKTGKSYMEKLLKSSSPERKVLHDVSANSPLLMLTAFDQNESGLEVLEVREVCQRRENIKRKNSSPPDEDKIMLNPSMYQSYEVSKDDKISEVPDSYATMVSNGISSTFDRVTGEKDIAVDGETKTEDNLIGYQSDDIASEVDNYVDAPSTIDSEIDTDSEMRLKSNSSSSLNKTQPLISEPDEDLHNRSSDSQSIEESVMSDERNSSSKKETSSFSTSDSPSVSAENTKSKAISEIDKDDDPLHYRRTADENVPVHQNPNPLISDHMCTSTEAITNHRSDFEQLASSFCSTDLPPTLEHLNSGVVGKNRTGEPESDDFASVSDVERKVNLVIGGPCAPGVSDFASQSGDDSRRSSAGEQAVDEPSGDNIPHEDTVSDDHTDSLIVRSSDFLPPEEYDCEYLNLIENIASSPNTATENAKLGRLDRKLTEIFWSGRHDKAHFDDDTMSTVSKMEKPTDQLDNEDSNVFANASNRFSHTTENFHVKELTETSLSIELRDLATEEHFCVTSIDNQIDSENLILPLVENSPECPGEALDAHERNVPEEELTVNENIALGTSESCKVVSLLGEEVTDLPPEVAALESGSPENLEEISAVLDNVENDEITPCTNPIEDEVDEILDSSDIKLVDDISVLLDESASEIGLLVPEKMAHLTPAISENANENNVSLPVGLDKSVEEPTPCSEDSDLGEHKDAQNCLWETQKESVLVEQVGEREATASDVDIIISNSPNNGTVESDAPKNIPNSYFDLDVEETFDFVDGTTIRSPLEQSGLDAEQEIIQQNGVPTCVSDPCSSLTDTTSEERISQEKIELPSSQLDEEVINSREISSGLSPFLPIELPEHDDKKVDNNSDNTDPVFSRITSPSPPFSEVPGLSNCNIDVSEYPDGSLGSILPPSNLVSETNEINLDELPPLPPLPPVQWRMGKFQLGSAHTNGKIIKPELFPRVNFPPIGSTDAVSSSLEDMNHSVVQVAPETAKKVEQSLSSLDANSVLETIDLQSVKQNEPHQPAASTDDVSSSLEETNHSLIQIIEETASKVEKVDLPMNDAVDLPPKIESKITTKDDVSSSLEEIDCSLLHINPETAPKAENVQQSSSSSNPDVIHETIDIPPKIETEQRKLIMPFPTSELTPPAEEDEVANGSHKLKLPRPRNPLINDVVALDKSKLRKVTERVRPQIQQVDERDSLLEQIRTKSFNLKPAMASRPSIRGPRTNLKVAAILEKANAIRQALAGSDEDDEDNWSDS